MKSRVGPEKAITARAHKSAKIIYMMIRYGVAYKESGHDYYDQQYRDRAIKNLQKKAAEFGLSLVGVA